jgi:hypothetical protein
MRTGQPNNPRYLLAIECTKPEGGWNVDVFTEMVVACPLWTHCLRDTVVGNSWPIQSQSERDSGLASASALGYQAAQGCAVQHLVSPFSQFDADPQHKHAKAIAYGETRA